MKSLILMALILLGLAGCRPEEAETQFNEVLIGDEALEGDSKEQPPGEPEEKVLPPEVVSVCTEIKEEQACVEAPDCQPLKSEDGSELVSCIETPIQRPPGGGGGEEETSGGGETTEANYACQKADPEEGEGKNQKVAVCHVPKGNPENLHTICISIKGWENGHKDRHGNEQSRDHLGACTQRELDVIGGQG